jgi:hypothetical protein
VSFPSLKEFRRSPTQGLFDKCDLSLLGELSNLSELFLTFISDLIHFSGRRATGIFLE